MSKILIIDDEKTILDNLKYILELEGYDVMAASGGKEGINLFLEYKNFDAVISDMRMPGLSGIEVIKAIKQQDEDVGIIILTGNGDMENAVLAMKEGAYDYLNKPIHADKLIFSLENAIKKLNLIRENRKLQDDIYKKNLYFQSINDSASQILLNMAPKEVPQFDSLKLSAIYKSCDRVGGDMYDVFELGDKILFYLFDVCGHGILSAVMTMILKSSFSNLKFLYKQAGIIPHIEDILQSLNQEMYASTASNLFATLFAGIYDKKQGEVTYISAGHVDQYLISGDNLFTISSTGTVIGIFQDIHYKSATIKVSPSDRLYLFTDGITEIWREEPFVATEEIMKTIMEKRGASLNESVASIYRNLMALYKDKEPDDDITIVGIEFTP